METVAETLADAAPQDDSGLIQYTVLLDGLHVVDTRPVTNFYTRRLSSRDGPGGFHVV